MHGGNETNADALDDTAVNLSRIQIANKKRVRNETKKKNKKLERIIC